MIIQYGPDGLAESAIVWPLYPQLRVPPRPTTCSVCGRELWEVNGWLACPEPGHTRLVGSGGKVEKKGRLPTRGDMQDWRESFGDESEVGG